MSQNRKLWGLRSLMLLRIGTFLLCTKVNVIDGAPPETLGIPIIQSFLQGSSDGLKELVQTHSNKLLPQLSAEAPPKTAQELNNLISKLKPKQGRLDPVVMEMLSAFDRTYRDTTGGPSSTEGLMFPDETTSGRVASSTEENGIIWQDTASRPQKRDRDSSKFSSRYRSNKTEPTGSFHNFNNTDNDSDHSVSSSSLLPFDHITDPNIRNHRLYDWEFETYKNFTHIDQAEDLMADEDRATETKVLPPSVASLPPHPSQSSNVDKLDKNGESIIPSGWATKANRSKSKRVQVKGIPHIVISLEDTSDNGFDHRVHVPASYLKHSMDSGEPPVQRPREPLRHSSTENVVFVHGSAEDRFPGDERYPDRKFRPSTSDLSDAVFIDPDEDFYTSTVRSNDPHHHHHQSQDEHEISSETLPKRRRKKLRKIVKKEDIDELAHNGRFSNRNGEHQLDEDDHRYGGTDYDRGNHGVNYSPDYSRNAVVGNAGGGDNNGRSSNYNNVYHTPGPHVIKPSKYLGPVDNSRLKSDRVLYPGGGHDDYSTGQDHHHVNPSYDGYDETTANQHHDGGIGNYYSLHNDDPGMHSSLGSSMGDGMNDGNQHAFQNHHDGNQHHPFQNHEGNQQQHPFQNQDANQHPFQNQNGNQHPFQNHNGNQSPYKNPDVTSTEYLGIGNRVQSALSSALNMFGNNGNGNHQTKKLQASPTDQVLAPGHMADFYHPYAAADDQVNQYYEDSSYNSWSNTFFILAAIIAFTAIFALLLPTFIAGGRYGKKDIRNDLDDEDLNASSYAPTGSGSNNHNHHYQYDNTQDDVGQHSDIWTEIKGAYNDILNLFRGDFSMLTKNKKQEAQGPKIVYRDEEDQDESDEEDEDDERNENGRLTLRHRKRQQYIKKQQLLQKQQQQQHKRAQQLLREQKAKKTLVSKSSGVGRENKDVGKTINATSVNNLVVVSSPSEPLLAKIADPEESSPRAVTGFVFPENSTLATIPFTNTTGMFGSAADTFLREWAQVQLINNQ